MSAAYIVYAILGPFNDGQFMIPGLNLSKLYSNSALVLLNNRFTIPGGRNASHPDFDIASYRCSDVAGGNAGTAISHGIAFAHTHLAETTSIRDGMRTIELAPHPGRVSEELKATHGKETKLQEV